MRPEVKRELLLLMQDVHHALAQDSTNVATIKRLSNHTIHTATLFLDKDAISLTVIVYALSKVLDRAPREEISGVCKHLLNARNCLAANRIQQFREHMRRAFGALSKLDANMNLYVDDVLTHAQVKKGCKICDHGISCTTSAHLLDVTQWDLMQYLGKTSHGRHTY